MFGIGGFELFIILVFGFLIFGPEKLPDIARTVGRGIARFREAQEEMKETIGNDKIFDPSNPDEPFKDPIEALDKLAARQEEKRRGKESAESGKAGQAKAAAASAAKPDEDSELAENEVAAGAAPARQESFTERKARYERERAARKAAEAQADKDSGKGAPSGSSSETQAAAAVPGSAEGGEA